MATDLVSVGTLSDNLPLVSSVCDGITDFISSVIVSPLHRATFVTGAIPILLFDVLLTTFSTENLSSDAIFFPDFIPMDDSIIFPQDVHFPFIFFPVCSRYRSLACFAVPIWAFSPRPHTVLIERSELQAFGTFLALYAIYGSKFSSCFHMGIRLFHKIFVCPCRTSSTGFRLYQSDSFG